MTAIYSFHIIITKTDPNFLAINGSFTDEGDDGTMLHTVPYDSRDGFVGVERAKRMYSN